MSTQALLAPISSLSLLLVQTQAARWNAAGPEQLTGAHLCLDIVTPLSWLFRWYDFGHQNGGNAGPAFHVFNVSSLYVDGKILAWEWVQCTIETTRLAWDVIELHQIFSLICLCPEAAGSWALPWMREGTWDKLAIWYYPRRIYASLGLDELSVSFTKDTSAIDHLNQLENFSPKFYFESPRGQWVKERTYLISNLYLHPMTFVPWQYIKTCQPFRWWCSGI